MNRSKANRSLRYRLFWLKQRAFVVFSVLLVGCGLGSRVAASPTVPLTDKKLAVLEFKIAPGVHLKAPEYLADECRGAVTKATRKENLFVANPENLDELLKLNGGKCVEGECELETARNLGVDYFIAGNVALIDGKLVLNLKVMETRGGRQLDQQRVSAEFESELLDLIVPTTNSLLRDGFGLTIARGQQGSAVTVGTFGDTAAHVDMSIDTDTIVGFESIPKGATVRLDGKLLCPLTPCTKSVGLGLHEVVFEKERYVETTISATIGEGAVVSAKLAPTFGWLDIQTRPDGVAVTINGKPAGTTPIENKDVDAGGVEVAIADPCFVRKGEGIVMGAGEHKTVSLAAEPRLAGLRVDAESDDGNAIAGDLYVDGALAGPLGRTLKVSVCAKRAALRVGGSVWESGLKLEEDRTTVVAARRRGWSIVRVVAGDAVVADALAATTTSAFHERLDAGLAKRWQAHNRAAIVSAIDEVRGEKPRDPVALAWLAVVLDAEGLPETARALLASVDDVDGMAPGAAAAFREREDQARSIEISVGGVDDAPLSPDEHDGLRRALTGWVASWSARAEPVPETRGRAGALGAALAVVQRELGAVPEGHPTVIVDDAGGRVVVRVVAGAWRVPPALDVDVGARREPLHVDAALVGDRKARVAVQLRPWARVVDEDLSRRFAAGDAAGVIDGVAALHARLPGDPIARDWLVAALGTLGLPETAAALRSSGTRASSSTAAARAADAVAGALRTTTLRVVTEPGASLTSSDGADVDAAIDRWLRGWATDDEPLRQDVAAVASRALVVVRTIAPDVGSRHAVIDKRVVDDGIQVTVRHGRARRVAAFSLRLERFADVDVGVGSDTLAASSATQTVQLVRAARVSLVVPESDEKLTVDGRALAVDARGRAPTTKLPHRLTIARQLGVLQRTDVVDIADGQTEVVLTSWPLLERAERAVGGAWDGRTLSPDAVAVVDELCATPAGAHGARLRDGVFARKGAFLELVGAPSTATFAVDGAPASIVHCDGRTWLSLARDTGNVSLATATGARAVVVDAAARQAGRLELEARVHLTSSSVDLRWRGDDGAWRTLDEAVVVPASAASVRVQVAAPRRTPVEVVVTAALGARREHAVPIEATTAALLPAWAAWHELQDTRTTTWALAGIPAGLAIAAGGAAGVGAWYNADAQDARSAYNATADIDAARVLRTRTVESVTSANAWATGAAVAGVLALASTAAPVVWALVLHPDAPSPEEFPTTPAASAALASAWRAEQRQATTWQMASIPVALGLVAGGATAMSVWANEDAQVGLATYNDAVDPNVAALQRSTVDGKVASANAWAGTAIVSGVLAVASTAFPLACALWPAHGEPVSATTATSPAGTVATAAEAR